jgi:hypothetical protein
MDPLTHATEPEFILGDMYIESEEMSALLADTIWQSTLPPLRVRAMPTTRIKRQAFTVEHFSSSRLPLHCSLQVVIINGKLDGKDGFDWQGDLRMHCPDTAPYSMSTSYKRN